MTQGPNPLRIASMDQFRGYTVAGMFLVNFLGGFAAIHSVLKHNDTYFSYADSIMPSFMFAVGFSFRLTYLRRKGRQSSSEITWSYVRRSLALVLVSLVMYGFGEDFRKWSDFSEMPQSYQPFRKKAEKNASFELLIDKASQDDPKRDRRAVLDVGSKIGELLNANPRKRAENREAAEFAEKAAAQAVADGEAFVAAELERKKSWDDKPIVTKVATHWRILVFKFLKANLWETLGIIGMTQLVILPFIGGSFAARFLTLIGFCITHTVISYFFNWDFLYGLHDNWLSKVWMTGEATSWDGGFFGPIAWGIAMLAGTLAYDLFVGAGEYVAAARKLMLWGVCFMAVGYVLSGFSRVYEMNEAEGEAMKQRRIQQDAERGWLGEVMGHQGHTIGGLQKPINDLQGKINEQKDADFRAVFKELSEKPENKGKSKHTLADMAEAEQKASPRANATLKALEADMKKLKEQNQPQIERLQASIGVLRDQSKRYEKLDLAESPVLPPLSRIKSKSLSELIPDPPFVKPPHDEPRIDPGPHVEHRPRNYWMLGKRMPNVTFMLFATGFAFALYGVFILLCDVGGVRVGVFRTFGTNALAAYFLHHVVDHAVSPVVPRDSPLVYALMGFGLFFLITYALVRYLEKNNIFIKL